MDHRKIRSADILVLGGHHYGNYPVAGPLRPRRFSRGDRIWNLHQSIGTRPINEPRLIMITGCNAINGASMSYQRRDYMKDNKTRIGMLIALFSGCPGKGSVQGNVISSKRGSSGPRPFENFSKTRALSEHTNTRAFHMKTPKTMKTMICFIKKPSRSDCSEAVPATNARTFT